MAFPDVIDALWTFEMYLRVYEQQEEKERKMKEGYGKGKKNTI